MQCVTTADSATRVNEWWTLNDIGTCLLIGSVSGHILVNTTARAFTRASPSQGERFSDPPTLATLSTDYVAFHFW